MGIEVIVGIAGCSLFGAWLLKQLAKMLDNAIEALVKVGISALIVLCIIMAFKYLPLLILGG